MDYHKNAPWTAVSRERLARMVMEEGWKLGAAAARFSVSAKTAAKWLGRYRQFGTAGLADCSSRPHHCPRQTAFSLLEKVLVLRREHMPGYEIARRTGLSPASVSRILRRAKLSRWRDLNAYARFIDRQGADAMGSSEVVSAWRMSSRIY